jgi:DNA-binding PucR family transcriptional regulator
VDDLGPYALLYPLWGTPESRRFVAGILGDLPAHDTRHGGDLLPTLLAYLRHGGAAGDAAADLGIHRNTLAYRLRRIEELCGRSPLDPAQHLSLHLAALLHTLPPPEDQPLPDAGAAPRG